VWDTFNTPTRADKYTASVRAAEMKYKFDYGDEDPAGFFLNRAYRGELISNIAGGGVLCI
jgi:hypothetical protein